jgi:hypothetical protein
MRQILYVSTESNKTTKEFLKKLIDKSIENNRTLNVTGMLLYHKGTFLQILEGDPDDIENLYSKIKRNEHHKSMNMVYNVPIVERTFSNWAMGFVDAEELFDKGDKDFFSFFKDITESKDQNTEAKKIKAKKIIDKFQSGTWRSYIH